MVPRYQFWSYCETTTKLLWGSCHSNFAVYISCKSKLLSYDDEYKLHYICSFNDDFIILLLVYMCVYFIIVYFFIVRRFETTATMRLLNVIIIFIINARIDKQVIVIKVLLHYSTHRSRKSRCCRFTQFSERYMMHEIVNQVVIFHANLFPSTHTKCEISSIRLNVFKINSKLILNLIWPDNPNTFSL